MRTAGWVISVCRSSSSAAAMAAESDGSAKAMLLSGRPSSRVVMRSESTMTSFTTGSIPLSVASMLTYWLPCPV